LKILLDTHNFLWAITEDPRLTRSQRSAWVDEDNELYLSIASVWEMLIKAGTGRLPLPTPAVAYLSKQMDKNRVVSLAIRASHMAELEMLPPLHRDPFDRMLVAQARAERMPLLSGDLKLSEYDVQRL
jgi:PIN domain nuclease of toxin-antitoxin system